MSDNCFTVYLFSFNYLGTQCISFVSFIKDSRFLACVKCCMAFVRSHLQHVAVTCQLSLPGQLSISMYSQEHYQSDNTNEWQTISCSRHYPDPAVRASAWGGNNENASLVLKRKRGLWSKGEGSIFILAWGAFSFWSVSEYRMHCLISVPLQLSCPNSNLLWFMWLRSCFQWSHLTMKRVYVSRCWGASISDKQLLFTPTKTHRWHDARNNTEENQSSISWKKD